MQLAASFLGVKNIPKTLEQLNKTDIDFIHVDVMDGKFTSKKTLPFREMKQIYKFTNKRLDVHLMVEHPDKYIRDYAQLNTEYITIHLEVGKEVKKALEHIHSYGIKCGLSIKPSTPIIHLLPYIADLDLVLLMSVEPGASGQSFFVDTPERLQQLKKLIVEERSHAKISIDGGLNPDTVSYVGDADVLVSGSYITSQEDYQGAIDLLRNKAQ